MAGSSYPARDLYKADNAADYLVRRKGQKKWIVEQEAFEGLLAQLPAGSRVLDVPIGTGRFTDAYLRSGHTGYGVDISLDMLSQVGRPGLVQGEAERLPFPDSSVDCILSSRFLNLVPPPVLASVIAEFARVARGRFLLEVRVSAPCGRLKRLAKAAGEFLAHPRSAARRMSLAIRQRPGTGRSPRGYFIHPVDEVHRVFAANALRVRRILDLPDGSSYTRLPLRFTPLRIYVLDKKQNRAGSRPASGQRAGSR